MEDKQIVKPDFPDWIKSKAGKDCMKFPVESETYLFNRLFWAFDAGRDYAWNQYTETKVENANLKERFKNFVNVVHRNSLENQRNKFLRELHPLKDENKDLKERVAKLEESLTKIVDAQFNPNKSLANLNSEIKNANSLLNSKS